MNSVTATMTVRVSNEEKALVQDYAKLFGMSVSELIRKTVLEKIEDELDLGAWKKAKESFNADPKTIPADEIARKYL